MTARIHVAWLKATAGVGLIAGLLISWRLWLSARSFPLTPVLPFLHPVPYPFDCFVFCLLLALLALSVALPRPSRLIAVFLCAAWGYALFDQQRWQPWFYQYWFMLMAIGLGRPEVCRLIVAAIYFWSGIHKINPIFVHETFPWMTGGLPLEWLACAAPFVESAIAIGLLTRGFRNVAVVAALGMHAFILASIGPWGHRHNVVVWPWNIAMAVFVVLLFWKTPRVGPREIVWGSGWFHRVVLVLFAVMPALSLADRWDSYLSFSLYSGNQRKATIYMSDAVADKLPERVQQVVYVYQSPWKVDTLELEEWSYDELHVPVYPETRVFRNVARRVCEETGNSPQMALVVEDKWSWFARRRMKIYPCQGRGTAFRLSSRMVER